MPPSKPPEDPANASLPDETPEFSRPLRLARLGRNAPHTFAETADASECAAVAGLIGALGVSKLRIEGEMRPIGAEGWRLIARLGVTVTQPCVATLAPVRTRIDRDISRQYMPLARDGARGHGQPGAPLDLDADADTETEDLPAMLDLGLVAIEETVLALPAYPRADTEPVVALSAAPPGAAPITQETVKPFAGLAGLREKMRKDPD